MSFDINKQNISKYIDKKIYLFDSGVFARSEEISSACKVDFIDVFNELPAEYFFVSNEVVVEIANGPRHLNYGYFMHHILNSEGAMDSSWKENRFLIEEAGEIRYVVLNKISNVDYGQVTLAQNHKELTLVSNDRKLLKSAAQIIPGRVLGMPVLIERLSEKYPQNKKLKVINTAVKKIYELKNPFSHFERKVKEKS